MSWWRLTVLGLGLAVLLLAARAWMAGSPPAWSLFAPHVETVVLLSEPRDEVRPDGKVRHWPHIEVAWPPGGSAGTVVEGLIRPKNPHHLHTAEELVSKHPAGSVMTVRDVGGVPFADRRDLRDLAMAFGLTGVGGLIVIGGIVLVVAGTRRKGNT
jgi:hypothetical protein